MPLSNQTIKDVNALGTDAIFLVLLQINIPSMQPEYIVNNTENITWNGNEYISFPFTYGDIDESTVASVPQVTLTMSNVNRIMERYLQDYDRYLKINGIDGNEITCIASVINTNDIDNSEPIISYETILSQPSTNATTATFEMTASSPYNKTFPPRKILKTFCTFVFKDKLCKYSGTENICDKTLDRCRELNNSSRFGGFPGASGTGITVV